MSIIKKSICFVTETARTERPIQDPSVRYRCYHPAEILSKRGHICAVYAAQKFYEDPSFDYDVYVFHRPSMARANFLKVISFLRTCGKKLIADYDDLIFGSEDIAIISSAVKNNTLTPERAIAAFSSNLAGLRQFDMVTVSTEPLAAKVREFNPDARVSVVHNMVPESIFTIQENYKTPFRKRAAGAIGYFAGTKSHDRDFPVVEAALQRVLSENPAFTLLVVGPVAIPQGIASLPNVSRAPAVSYARLFSPMSRCSTVIAPLEDSAFNACKSRVKFLEAAVAGCRLIASPIPDMQIIGSKHLTCASSLDEWYEALSMQIDPHVNAELVSSNFEFLRNSRQIDGLDSFGEIE
ncbi:hypothetical protein [Castellaniella sp.]|uniref:hypothetical protein n=1 Tax=Castellaniella sp. TaxID=1955812 RepID=UPI002AFFB331|nr:hypothetical protein [Castellaniella sp.]